MDKEEINRSETNNLKLFKHDNPSTNTNQFDVQKALNENWDKIDSAIGEINEKNTNYDEEIKNIKDKNTEQDTSINQIKEEQLTQNTDIDNLEKKANKLEEENELLRNQIPIGQATGENISLNDSSNLPYKKLVIEGKSEQETREGYNLLKDNYILTPGGETPPTVEIQRGDTPMGLKIIRKITIPANNDVSRV